MSVCPHHPSSSCCSHCATAFCLTHLQYLSSLRSNVHDPAYCSQTHELRSVPQRLGLSGGDVDQEVADLRERRKESLNVLCTVCGGYGSLLKFDTFCTYCEKCYPGSIANGVYIEGMTAGELKERVKLVLDVYSLEVDLFISPSHNEYLTRLFAGEAVVPLLQFLQKLLRYDRVLHSDRKFKCCTCKREFAAEEVSKTIRTKQMSLHYCTSCFMTTNIGDKGVGTVLNVEMKNNGFQQPPANRILHSILTVEFAAPRVPSPPSSEAVDWQYKQTVQCSHDCRLAALVLSTLDSHCALTEVTTLAINSQPTDFVPVCQSQASTRVVLLVEERIAANTRFSLEINCKVTGPAPPRALPAPETPSKPVFIGQDGSIWHLAFSQPPALGLTSIEYYCGKPNH